MELFIDKGYVRHLISCAYFITFGRQNTKTEEANTNIIKRLRFIKISPNKSGDGFQKGFRFLNLFPNNLFLKVILNLKSHTS
jgi:hypothetical protein